MTLPYNPQPGRRDDRPTAWDATVPYMPANGESPYPAYPPSYAPPPPAPRQRRSMWGWIGAVGLIVLVVILLGALIAPRLQHRLASAPGPTATPQATATPAPHFNVALLDNNVGTTSDSSPETGNFDSFGNSYSRDALAVAGYTPGAKVVYDGITFTWPDAPSGAADNMVVQHQTLPVDANAPYTTLGFLGASHFGGTQLTITITFADGTQQQAKLGLSDWTEDQFGIVQYDNAVVATLPYHNNNTKSRQDTKTYLFYAKIPLDSGKIVQSITFPNSSGFGQMHIFAIGVK